MIVSLFDDSFFVWRRDPTPKKSFQLKERSLSSVYAVELNDDKNCTLFIVEKLSGFFNAFIDYQYFAIFIWHH